MEDVVTEDVDDIFFKLAQTEHSSSTSKASVKHYLNYRNCVLQGRDFKQFCVSMITTV